MGIALIFREFVKSREISSLPQGWMIIRPPSEVSCLLACEDAIWAGGKDGLFIIDRHTGKALQAENPHFGHVRALLADYTGGIWVAHDCGLAQYRSGKWHILTRNEGFPFDRALSLCLEKRGSILVGSTGSIARYDGRKWEKLSLNGIVLDTADVLFYDNNGNLWVGCSSPVHGALFCYDGRGWKEYTVRDGLPHPSVNMLSLDSQGNLWVATGFASRGGAAFLSGVRWIAATMSHELAGKKIRSIYCDRKGRLWFGSEYDGVAILEGKTWVEITPGKGLAGKEVKAVLQDKDDLLWIGTDGGLTRISRWDDSPLFNQRFSPSPSAGGRN